MGEALYHHGVLGMKWGVRKDSLGSGRSSSNKSNSNRMKSRKGSVNVDTFKPQTRPTDLPDDQLRQIIARIRLEKEYRDLVTPKNNESIKKGSEWVGAAKKGVTIALTGIVTAGLTAYVRKKARGTNFEW